MDEIGHRSSTICVSGWEGCGKSYAIARLPMERCYKIPEIARIQVLLDPGKKFFVSEVTRFVLPQYLVSLKIALDNQSCTIVSDRGVVDVMAFVLTFEPSRIENRSYFRDFIKRSCDILQKETIYDRIVYINKVEDESKISDIVSDKNRLFSDNADEYLINSVAWEHAFFDLIEENPRLTNGVQRIENYLKTDVGARILEECTRAQSTGYDHGSNRRGQNDPA